MELIIELMKLVLPAGFVLVAMYLTVKAFVNKDFELAQKQFEQRLADLKIEHAKISLPLKIQAFERMCLFLERISLSNIVLRVNDPSFTAWELQQKLIMDIRDEFNHNLSQQIYMSDDAWTMIKRTHEEVITIINKAGEYVSKEGKSIDLAKKIFELLLDRKINPTDVALKFIKDELRNSI